MGSLASPSGWVWQTATNVVRRRERRRRLEDQLLRRRAASRPDDHDAPPPDVDLQRALLELTERQRSAISSSTTSPTFRPGRSPRSSGVASGTVEATLHQARQRLHRTLNGKGPAIASPNQTEPHHERSRHTSPEPEAAHRGRTVRRRAPRTRRASAATSSAPSRRHRHDRHLRRSDPQLARRTERPRHGSGAHHDRGAACPTHPGRRRRRHRYGRAPNRAPRRIRRSTFASPASAPCPGSERGAVCRRRHRRHGAGVVRPRRRGGDRWTAGSRFRGDGGADRGRRPHDPHHPRVTRSQRASCLRLRHRARRVCARRRAAHVARPSRAGGPRLRRQAHPDGRRGRGTGHRGAGRPSGGGHRLRPAPQRHVHPPGLRAVS